MIPPFRLVVHDSPVILSLPHVGVHLPQDVAAHMTPAALAVADTDWNVDRLYDFAPALGVTVLAATHSRYLLDLNRPADDASLYPGQTTTGLCPRETFAGEPLYAEDRMPDAEETQRRLTTWWQPYHQALQQQLEHKRRQHGYAVLLDGHSILSEVPRLFPGRLPDINLGTAEGRSCSPALTQRIVGLLESQRQFSHVVNGRFKGGHITRAYGQPQQQVHALQIELAQAAYMQEGSSAYDAGLAAPLRALLGQVVTALLEFRPVIGS